MSDTLEDGEVSFANGENKKVLKITLPGFHFFIY